MCYPKREGGLGFRSPDDMCNSFFAKLWWNFRTPTSLWSIYMWNKYCEKVYSTLTRGNGGSHVWRKITSVRDEVEHNIWWKVR